MGRVIPFITRVSRCGDWSAEERERLQELGERLAAAGLKVEVVYGATEEGDPWCVVKDEFEEVLIHVARIGGVFVVHRAFDDALRQGENLPAILAERLAWEEQPDVVAFARQAPQLLALLVAASFFYETRSEHDPVLTAPGAGEEPLPHETGAAHPAAHVQAASLLDGFAAHAKSHAGAAGLLLAPDEAAGQRFEWRSTSEDDTPQAVDHAAPPLAFTRVAVGGLAMAPSLAAPGESSAPDQPHLLVALQDHAGPTSAWAPRVVGGGDGGASLTVASFKPEVADHRTPSKPDPDPPPEAAGHWVPLDTDGDGRPDAVAFVDAGRKLHRPEAADHAEHEVILAVGHGLDHGAIA